ncbi:jg16915 [Pararge aegeria aegeria]|uniref:Jg16915 protein n=1 Tax=Pararge aegeria aegeria TaxID=348720 RepID=A0A8S4SJ54_9NEOP|nr:jg16915 [Pararge aegeria aegeria]
MATNAWQLPEAQNIFDQVLGSNTTLCSGSAQAERPVSKKKTSDDDNLVQVLEESIVMREERERHQEPDSDRLFMHSLLNDFENIPRHRKLSTKMERNNILVQLDSKSILNQHLTVTSPLSLTMDMKEKILSYICDKDSEHKIDFDKFVVT